MKKKTAKNNSSVFEKSQRRGSYDEFLHRIVSRNRGGESWYKYKSTCLTVSLKENKMGDCSLILNYTTSTRIFLRSVIKSKKKKQKGQRQPSWKKKMKPRIYSHESKMSFLHHVTIISHSWFDRYCVRGFVFNLTEIEKIFQKKLLFFWC